MTDQLADTHKIKTSTLKTTKCEKLWAQTLQQKQLHLPSYVITATSMNLQSAVATQINQYVIESIKLYKIFILRLIYIYKINI